MMTIEFHLSTETFKQLAFIQAKFKEASGQDVSTDTLLGLLIDSAAKQILINGFKDAIKQQPNG